MPLFTLHVVGADAKLYSYIFYSWVMLTLFALIVSFGHLLHILLGLVLYQLGQEEGKRFFAESSNKQFL